MPDSIIDQRAATSPYLLAALDYASRGWSIVQGSPVDKRPLRGGDAWAGSTDPDQLLAWWEEQPSGLVGVSLGPSHLLIIDIDMHEDDQGDVINGFASFERLLELLRIDWDELVANTVVSRTGSGGVHLVFEEPQIPKEHLRRLIGWLPGVDLLCGRSYAVLSPSPHPETGRTYRWDPNGRPVADGPGPLPAKLMEKVTTALISREKEGGESASYAPDAAEIFRKGARVGSRNDDLIRIVGWLRRRLTPGPDLKERIRQQVEGWRDRCQPPYRGQLEDLEFEKSFESAFNLPHIDVVIPAWGKPTAIVHDGVTEVAEMSAEALNQWSYPHLAPHLRYSREEGMVYRWRGTYWQAGGPRHEDIPSLLDELGFCQTIRRAVEVTTIRVLSEADDERAQTEARRVCKEWENWRRRQVESKALIQTAIRVASADELGVTRQTWDSIPQLFHCVNGAVDLETGVMHPHDSSRMNWSLARGVFDPTQQPKDAVEHLGLHTLGPAWRQMLSHVTEDEELQRYLQLAFGVSCFGDNRAKAMFILHGNANNGKTTLLNAVMAALGVNDHTYPLSGAGTYASSVDKHVLCESKGSTDQHPAGLAAALLRRMVVMSQEYTPHDRLRLEVVKAMTGNEVISARFMRQDFFELQARCTPWMATNEEVQLGAFDDSIRTRIKPIELDGEITADARKPISQVAIELAQPDERTALLTWLVLGARSVASGQSALDALEPAKIAESFSNMVFDQDSVMSWIDTRCVALATGERPELVTAFVNREIVGASVQTLFQDYTMWAQVKGMVSVSQVAFTRRVHATLRIGSQLKVRDSINGERVRMLPLALKQ